MAALCAQPAGCNQPQLWVNVCQRCSDQSQAALQRPESAEQALQGPEAAVKECRAGSRTMSALQYQ